MTTTLDKSHRVDWNDLELEVKALSVDGNAISATEIGYTDGLTPGTVTASKAVVVDSSKNISGFQNVTQRGPAGTGADSAAVLTLQTAETTVVVTDQLGRIDFQAPLEASGTDAILVSASIWAEAGNTFDTTVNDTDLVFATGLSETAAEKMRLDSSGVLTVSGAITPTGGVAAAGGFTARPSNIHTGGISARVNTDGTDTTPSVSETYYAAVFIPCNMTVTGVRVFLGSATEGNIKVGLFNSAGAVVATSASTDASGATVDAYFEVAFTSPYAAKGPATYYVGLLNDSTSNRFNSHTFGAFPTGKTTGETYATGFTTIASPATTFTTALGPIATLY